MVKILSTFPKLFLLTLERALRALASSSGGAACPGVPRVNPRSQGMIPSRFKQKKKIVTNEQNELTDGRTDVLVEIVI